MALAVSALLWIPFNTDESDAADVVSRYLEASRSGDIETALDLAGKHPKGETARFLAPEAVSDDWELTEVEERAYFDYGYPDDNDETATVAVTIETEAGKPVTGNFELKRKNGGKWKIADPLVKVSVRPSLLWYVDVNGVTAPYPALSEDDAQTKGATYLLLPGVYRFYANVPDTVAPPKSPATPLLKGTHAVDVAQAPDGADGIAVRDVKLSKKGKKAVASGMRDYIDDCVDMDQNVVAGCPFGIESVPDPADGDNELYPLTKVTWTVEKYPNFVAVTDDEALKLTDRERGTAKLTVTGLVSGKPVTTTMKCPINTSGLDAGVLPDGTVRIHPEDFRFNPGDFRSHAYDWETCDS